METTERRIMPIHEHAGYMDDNSNVCKSNSDHGSLAMDAFGVDSNTNTTDGVENGQQLSKQVVEGNGASEGNVIGSESLMEECIKNEVTQGNENVVNCDDANNNDDDDHHHHEGDEAPSPENVNSTSSVDEVDFSSRTAQYIDADELICGNMSEAEMRSRLTSGSKRDAVLLDDFELDDYDFESNSSHAISKVREDECGSDECQVSAVELADQHSTVADNEKKDNEISDRLVPDQSPEEMDTEATRNQTDDQTSTTKDTKIADTKSPTWQTCLVCFGERLAALGVSSKSFDNFVANSPMTDATACSGHVGAHGRLREAAAEVCGTGSEHRPTRTSERVQSENEVPAGDNPESTVSDSCDNAVTMSGAGDNRDDDVIQTMPRERCDAASAFTDVSRLAVDLLREFSRRLDFEREQRERAEDWAEFLMLELDAQIEARTEAEEAREALRQRTIGLARKYKKLKSEHANLVSQIRDMSMPDENRRDSGSSLLRRKTKSSTNRESLLAKRNAMMLRHSGQRQSSSESDNSGGESFSEPNGKKDSGMILRNLEDVKCKWESQYKKLDHQSGDDSRLSEEINMKKNDATILNKSDLSEYNVSPRPTTSTPIKVKAPVGDMQRLVLDESRASETSSPSQLGTKGGDGSVYDDEGDVVLVDVKASANMWEQLLQKKAGMNVSNVTEVSSNHEPVGGLSTSPKRMRIRDVEEFQKCLLENSKISDKGMHCGSDQKVSLSVDSEDGELSDLEYLSANEEFSHSGDILTDSINAKETREMWQCLSSSNTTTSSSPEPSKSPKNLSISGVIEQVKAKFENVSECANHNSVHSEPALQRSTKFSSLRLQWEEKGKC